MNEWFITWREVEDAIEAIALRIEGQRLAHEATRFKSIVGIARGGLVPAALLSYRLNLPASRIITPSTGAHSLAYPYPKRDELFIDDICDTGKTLKECFIPPESTVVLFAKPAAPNAYWLAGCNVPQDAWLVFPWAPHDEVNR